MSDNGNQDGNNSIKFQETGKDTIASSENTEQDSNKTSSSENGDQFTAGNHIPEIATNDGSVIETLDTVFHGTPGWSQGENISGSDRADYYEARSNGKSDVEEEVEELRRKNKNQSEDQNK